MKTVLKTVPVIGKPNLDRVIECTNVNPSPDAVCINMEADIDDAGVFKEITMPARYNYLWICSI